MKLPNTSGQSKNFQVLCSNSQCSPYLPRFTVAICLFNGTFCMLAFLELFFHLVKAKVHKQNAKNIAGNIFALQLQKKILPILQYFLTLFVPERGKFAPLLVCLI